LGLFEPTAIEEMLREHIPIEKLEELPIPLTVTVANLLAGKVEYRTQGPLVETLLASASIPFVFRPTQLEGAPFADGGIFDNFPIGPLQGCCDVVIGVNVNPIETLPELSNTRQLMARAFSLVLNSQLPEKRKQVDFFLQPDGLEEFSILDLGKAEAIYNRGYEAAQKVDWQRVLDPTHEA
ncbi:MAG TPA: hypothetical protein DCP28_19770, partial [Cytophagales bacterium]|nr:hypothetical protein [Cytophagales bacterium]